MLEILLEPLSIVQEAYGCLDEERLRAFSCRSSQDSEKELQWAGRIQARLLITGKRAKLIPLVIPTCPSTWGSTAERDWGLELSLLLGACQAAGLLDSLAVYVDLAWLSKNTTVKLNQGRHTATSFSVPGSTCTQRGIAPEKKAAGPSFLSILVLGHHVS